MNPKTDICSMYPQLFSFETPRWLRGFFSEQIIIYSYGFMIALGVFAAFLVTLRMSRKFGLDSDSLSSLFLWVFAAAFAGGRLFFYFEDFGRYLKNPSEMLRIAGGGFVFYGSLIFSIPVILWWLKSKKIPVRPFMDILAFAGPVVHSIGRIGCFLAGCCHGSECHNALGVTYTDPHSMASPLHTPLYPTQLFDIVVNLIILIIVGMWWKHRRFDGQMFLVYLMIYAVGRSIVEIFRGDEARGFVFNGWLSHSQFIAIIILGICGFVWRKWSKTKVLFTEVKTPEHNGASIPE